MGASLAAGHELASPPGGAASSTLRFWYHPVSPDVSGTNVVTLAGSDYSATGARQWSVRAFTSGGNQYVQLSAWTGTGGTGLQQTSVNLGPDGFTGADWLLITIVHDDPADTLTLYVNNTQAPALTSFAGIATQAPPGSRAPVLIGGRFDGNVGPNGTYVEPADGDFAGWALFSAAKAAADVAEWVTAGPGAVPETRPDRLALTEPQPGMVYQAQDDNSGVIRVSGFWYPVNGQPEPTGWEYQWDDDWVPFTPTTVGTSFTAEIPGRPVGTHDLKVRFANAPQVQATAADVSVGDVVLLIGDSNGAGAGTNDQTYLPSAHRGSVLSHDYGVREAVDKMSGPGVTRWNDFGSNGSGGSVGVLVVKRLIAARNRPCMIVPVARAAANSSHMAPGHNGLSFQERTGMYQSLLNRGVTLTGARKATVALVWTTPNDISAGLTAAQFGANLDLIAAAVLADFGCQTVVAKSHDTGQAGVAAFQAEVDARVAADPVSYKAAADLSAFGPYIHPTTDADLDAIAETFVAAITAAGPTTGILTEANDFLTTEAGDFLTQE